jgi:hypothetical protein
VINPSPIPEDVQTWGLMALGQADGYGAGITWAESHLTVSPCASGSTAHGFKFSDTGQGCWFEGSAHMAIALQIRGENAKADGIVQALRDVQSSAPNNNVAGIVAAYPSGAETGYGWSYPNALHIGATAWYIFAERKHNPFWQIGTSEAIPTILGGFQWGMSYAAWQQGDYATPKADQSLGNLATTGIKWLSLIVTGYQASISSTAITYTSPRTPTDADLAYVIARAHQLGMRVMLKPHVDRQDDSIYRGTIGTQFTTEAEWQAWFDSYRAFI